jgi:predicted nucleotidyltransferase
MADTNTISELALKIKNVILGIEPNAIVILFGSRARGDYRSDSDWDILVVTSRSEAWAFKDKVATAIYDLMLEYDQIITPFYFSKEKWKSGTTPSPLIENIRQEGVVL